MQGLLHKGVDGVKGSQEMMTKHTGPVVLGSDCNITVHREGTMTRNQF